MFFVFRLYLLKLAMSLSLPTLRERLPWKVALISNVGKDTWGISSILPPEAQSPAPYPGLSVSWISVAGATFYTDFPSLWGNSNQRVKDAASLICCFFTITLKVRAETLCFLDCQRDLFLLACYPNECSQPPIIAYPVPVHRFLFSAPVSFKLNVEVKERENSNEALHWNWSYGLAQMHRVFQIKENW